MIAGGRGPRAASPWIVAPGPLAPLVDASAGARRPRPAEPGRGRPARRTTPPSALRRLLPVELATRPHRRYNPLIDEWVLVSAGATDGRGWAGAREPEPEQPRRLRPGPATCARATARVNGDVQPGLRRDVRLHQRLRGAAAGRPRPRRVDDGLLRAEGERGLVPGRLLLAAPRPDARPRWRPTDVRRVVDVWADQTDRARRATTAGSRSSRTAARRWARRTRTRTARSGPARRCRGEAAREDATPGARHLGRDRAPPAPRLRRPQEHGGAAGRRRDRRLAGRRPVLGGLAVRDAR